MATYYTPSDYGTKYYKYFTDERGISVKLYIMLRGYSGIQYQIGRLQGLNFQIQGNEEVTAPIVKTNLQITMLDDMYYPGVDSLGIRYDGSAYYRFGNWVELYTPDSTKYLVELYYNETIIWRGYVTPDSYSESLDAIGSVTITARDNIGHLQDFDFDLGGDSSGLIKVTDLITQAFTKIEFPMNLLIDGFSTGDDKYLLSEDGSYCLGDLYFNASALEGKTYLDALEDVLNSLGFCLRYVDDASFSLAPLRAMPYGGYDESTASSEQIKQEFQFYGRRSGTRTFDPAYRQITENVNFEQEDEYAPDILFAKNGSKTLANRTFVDHTFVVEPTTPDGKKYSGILIQTEQFSGRYVLSSSSPSDMHGWMLIPTTDILNDEAYALQDSTSDAEGESMHNYLFLLANCGTYNTSTQTVTYVDINHIFARRVRTPQVNLTIKFAEHPAGFDASGKLGVYYSHIMAQVDYYVYYALGNGRTMYWNGTRWQYGATDARLSYANESYDTSISEINFSLSECGELGGNGYLYIKIARIIYYASNCKWIEKSSEKYGNYTPDTWQPRGLYARLESITFSAKDIKKKAESDTVTTICNTVYNVKCERNPLLGFLPISVNFVTPANYKNAFFVYDSNGNVQAAPYRWLWNTDSVALAFPVKVHQQILMYHYTTEEILEGDCGLMKGLSIYGSISFDAKNVYKSKNYLLKSCTFDLIKGRFVTAELRSYKYYTDLWSGNETYNNDKIS